MPQQICFVTNWWWRHEVKTFPRYCSFVWKIHRPPVNSPHKGQWREALICSLIFAWTNGWVNNRDAGDLRRNRAHYDVTVMLDHYHSELFSSGTFTEFHNINALRHPAIIWICATQISIGLTGKKISEMWTSWLQIIIVLNSKLMAKKWQHPNSWTLLNSAYMRRCNTYMRR